VAHYRRAIDAILRTPLESRSSSGTTELDFIPDPDKTFNRGYTSWFPSSRRTRMGANDSPKMIGEPVGKVLSCGSNSFVLSCGSELHNGDGICFFKESGELTGTLVNRAVGNAIYPASLDGLRAGLAIFRNHDHDFLAQVQKSRAVRRIGVRLVFSGISGGYRLTARDEDGVSASRDIQFAGECAQKVDVARAAMEKQFRKMGDTEFTCDRLELSADPLPFLPVSMVNDLRRGVLAALREARSAARPVQKVSMVPNAAPYPEQQLDYLGNVLNEKAAAFYRRHGVASIEPAAETGLDLHGRRVMTATYCIKYELGACPRMKDAPDFPDRLFLVDDSGRRLRLEFNCKECCMEVLCDF
jgi:23S rRNA 5-hydroxycytidine C2501 synthase